MTLIKYRKVRSDNLERKEQPQPRKNLFGQISDYYSDDKVILI